MNPVTRLPVIQVNNLLHSQKRNQERENHNHPLHTHVPNPDKPVGQKRQEKAHNSIKKADGKTLCTKLHPRTLVEKHEFGRIVSVHEKHGHLANDIMHSPGNAEEVNEDGTGQPDLRVVEKGLPRDNLLDEKWDPNDNDDGDEDQLVAGEDGGAVDGTHGEFGLGLDELGHGLGESGEVALVHGLGVLQAHVRPN